MVAGRPTQGFWVPRGHALPSGDWQRGGVTRQVAWILHSQPQEPWTRRGCRPSRARRGSPAVPFPSAFHLTERNDQTEQEERREIKQRLTRKVLWSERLVS